MSLLDRFRHQTAALPGGTVDEHEAVVELLALAAYADSAVSDLELSGLDAFDASHASWDDDAFSVLQHLPVALARARSGRSTVAALAARITTPQLRREAVAAVEAVLHADGTSGAESDFLRDVRSALA